MSLGRELWRRYRDGDGPRDWNEAPIDDMRKACEEYFAWCVDNQLKEDKVFVANGEIIHESVSKVRAFTLEGLLMWLGTTKRKWDRWRELPATAEVCEWAEIAIYEQKFVNAAAGLLNAGLVARELGIVDRQAREISGPDGESLNKIEMDDYELARRLTWAARVVDIKGQVIDGTRAPKSLETPKAQAQAGE